MKLLSFDEKHGIAKLIPSIPEDLWELYNIVEEGDLLIAKTRRVVKFGSENATSKSKVLVELGIRVEKLWFDIVSGALNVTGRVEICPDYLEGTRAHYHTIAVKVDTPLTIVKGRWTNLQKRRLMASNQLRGHAILIVAVDYDGATVAKVTTNSILETRELSHGSQSKRDRVAKEGDIRELFEEISETVKMFSSSGNEKVVLVGPGFAKEKLVEYLKENSPSLFRRVVYVGGATSGTPSAIDEALRDGKVRNKIKGLRLLEEVESVEEFFKYLGQGSKLVCYGNEEVGRALSMGAVRKLLIHEQLPALLGPTGMAEVERLLELADEKRCEVLLIGSRHEGGRKLRSIGGLAAFLRFAVE